MPFVKRTGEGELRVERGTFNVPLRSLHGKARMRRTTDPLTLWLASLCALIAATLVVGGATRLTNSGLSITEWKPIVGALPPLSRDDWDEAFAKYRAIPEFRIENPTMTLEGFKTIYFWEYAHRNLGRLLGLVFVIPFVVLKLRRKIPASLNRRLLIGFALGAGQGALGWFMVRSGLADRTDVSPFRLAAHLGLALVLYVHFLNLLLERRGPGPVENAGRGKAGPKNDGPGSAGRMRTIGGILLLLIALQIGFGALTAGLRAGYAYNTFPDMNGRWLPELPAAGPWLGRSLENSAFVQFVHRWLGLAIVAVAATAAALAERSSRASFLAAALIAAAQAATGIAALVLVMPIPLALAHQFGALVLLTAVVTARAALGPPSGATLTPPTARSRTGRAR